MLHIAWAAATKALGGIYGYAVVAMLALAIGAGGTWRVMRWRADAAETKTAFQAVRLVEHQAKITMRISMTFEQARLEDTARTDQLLQEVPIHVTPAIDLVHPVPCGFVRLFNAAAHDPLPDGACGVDDAASGVALSDVAQTTVRNDGAYDLCATQLSALQDWVRAQHKASGGE
jgi:hypothetical protein